MAISKASVYWIRLPEHVDPSTEGYIGVSTNVENRLRDHYKSIQKGTHKNPHLVNAVSKYSWDNLLKEEIYTGDEIDCYLKEEELRPVKATGWNIAPGGHRGPGWPLGKKRSEEYLAKMREKNASRKAATAEKKIASRNQRIAARQHKRETAAAALEDRRAKKELRKQILASEHTRILKERERRRLKRLAEGTLNEQIDRSNRPICKECNKDRCSVNYVRKGKTYYRRLCDSCGKKKVKKLPSKPNWTRSGYKKKPQCDLCGFKSLYPSQTTVFHINGDLNNIALSNLRTICLNCVEVVKRKEVTWKRGDLRVDY